MRANVFKNFKQSIQNSAYRLAKLYHISPLTDERMRLQTHRIDSPSLNGSSRESHGHGRSSGTFFGIAVLAAGLALNGCASGLRSESQNWKPYANRTVRVNGTEVIDAATVLRVVPAQNPDSTTLLFNTYPLKLSNRVGLDTILATADANPTRPAAPQRYWIRVDPSSSSSVHVTDEISVNVQAEAFSK